MEPLGDGNAREVCYLEQVLKVYSLAPLLIGALCFMFTIEDVVPELPASEAYCHASPAIMDSPSGTIRQNKLFPKSLLFMVFYHSKNT